MVEVKGKVTVNTLGQTFPAPSRELFRERPRTRLHPPLHLTHRCSPPWWFDYGAAERTIPHSTGPRSWPAATDSWGKRRAGLSQKNPIWNKAFVWSLNQKWLSLVMSGCATTRTQLLVTSCWEVTFLSEPAQQPERKPQTSSHVFAAFVEARLSYALHEHSGFG